MSSPPPSPVRNSSRRSSCASSLDRRIMYDVAYLKYLLKDDTFVSYFNVYLNLPIFPRRVTYIPTKDQFNIEPVLLRKYLHTHPGKLSVWLCEQRLPQFVNSHLYLHYKLCRAVCSEHLLLLDFEHLEDRMNLASLTDITGFYSFHHYLLDSEGRVLVNCWLAIERLHSLTNDERALYLEDMLDTYLYPDSPMSLPAAYREAACQHITQMCQGVRFVKRHHGGDYPYLQQFKDKLLISKRLFRPLQDQLLTSLRDYWLHRYLSHLTKVDCDNTDLSRKSDSLYNLLPTTTSNLVDNEQLDINIDGLDAKTLPRSYNMNFCTDNGLNRTSQMVYSHELGMDVTTDEIKELSGDDGVNERMIDRTMKHFVKRMERQCMENRVMSNQSIKTTSSTASMKGPDMKVHKQSTRSMSFQQTSPTRLASISLDTRSNSVASPMRLASLSGPGRGSLSGPGRKSLALGESPLSQFHSAFDLEKQKFVQKIQHGRRPSGIQDLSPLLKSVNWSRHASSRVKETRVEAYLQEELELFMCCPCSLRDEIYKENYCDALKLVYNETSLKEVDINNFLEVSIASDFIGGEDFKNYLMRSSDKKPLYNYQLWTAIEQYSFRYAACDEMTFCARGRGMQVVGFLSEQEKLTFEWSFNKNMMIVGKTANMEKMEKELYSLLYQYTHPDGNRYVDWNDPFTDSLWFAIVNKYSVQEWLGLAQKFAAKKLTDSWLKYLQIKENEFLEKCTVLRQGKPIPTALKHTSEDLLFETMNSPNCNVMWAAMQLAEAIEYPGQNLPVIGHKAQTRNLSPDRRSPVSNSLSPSVKSTSPIKPFSDYQPPSRRMLASVTPTTPAVVVSDDVVAAPITGMAGITIVPARRGDALPSDPTLSQLEYNLEHPQDVDLNMDKMATIPKCFMDILRTKELLQKFRMFLKLNDDNHDPSILFWQIVESLKTCKSPKQRQERMQFITQKFFGPVSSMKGKLLIDKHSQVFKELCITKKVTHPMLISAQTLIAKELESIYWLQFIEMLPGHIRQKIVCAGGRGPAEGIKFGKEKNRQLWVAFTINVINFKKGIMDPDICVPFKNYIRDYVQQIASRCTKNTQKRLNICNKLIDIEKVENDLDFFIEVEKYKEICESCQYSARAGNYDPAEEEMCGQKARVLFNCYIDSLIPPKVQVNIATNKVTEIRKLHESGLYERGMFHDAALSIFPILAHFWKRFCLQRYAPMHVDDNESDKLIEQQRNVYNKHKSAKPNTPSNIGVTGTMKQPIQVNHVSQGVLQLLLRYTESNGISEHICQNDPNLNKNMGSRMSQANSRMLQLGAGGKDSPKMDALTLGIKPEDRRLSVMTNNDRRSSIMSPGRISAMRGGPGSTTPSVIPPIARG